MTTLSEVVSRMRAALALSEPELDTTVGTPVRKIIDAVGEVIAEAYVDKYLFDYQYDIDAKAGADLDEFVRLFGMSRFPAKRATGIVTFERNTPATTDILIPTGVQVTTTGATPVVAQTTSPALIVIGQSSVDVPVQATTAGTPGNVVANSLRYRTVPLAGITSFTNPGPLTGGADAESDAALRQRFTQTLFRNMAGTESMFLATALNDPDVTKAVVIGAIQTWRETIEVSGGTATSAVTTARHVYPDSSSFGTDLEGGAILTPGVHYTFNTGTNPPTITVIDPDAAPDGIYELSFEYVPSASRNDPTNGITNRVDLYVTGQRLETAVESLTFRTGRTFNTTGGSPLNRTNFQRLDMSNPQTGNYFIAFSMAPVIDPAPDQTIVINGVTYTEGTDFHLVNDISREGGTRGSLSGIELVAVANGGTKAIPADGTSFTADYIFNAVPGDVEQAVREWRLITTDVRVHQATPVYLDLHFALIYDPGYTEASLRPAIEAALTQFLSGIEFSGLVQVSDLLDVVKRVRGVDAVRFLTSSDHATEYAIQRVSPGGTVLTTYATNVGGQIRRALDVKVGEHEYPVLNSVTLFQRALNNFGAV